MGLEKLEFPPNYNKKLGIRRDVSSMEPCDPIRRRFFICLKMLGILPTNKPHWKYASLGHYQIDKQLFRNWDIFHPKSIHDEIIATHNTICQHHSPLFHYYHRYFMTYIQLQLNYADQYLRDPKTRQQKANDPLWLNVITDYQKIIDQLIKQNKFQQKVSCLYFNPTNYKTKKNKSNEEINILQYPSQLKQRNVQDVCIDELYYKINEHYPWNFNLRTRWYKISKEQYKKNKDQFQVQYVKDNEIHKVCHTSTFMNQKNKQTNQKLLKKCSQIKQNVDNEAYSKLNPRQNPKQFFQKKGDYKQYLQTVVDVRNQEYFDNKGDGQTIPIYSFRQPQLRFLFGIEPNQHWISKQQRFKFQAQQHLKAIAYNNSLPHYQFARAYNNKNYGKLFQSYLQDYHMNTQSSQYTHDTMHDGFGPSMRSPNFAPANFIFILYHTYIDYQLQVKLRQVNMKDEQNLKQKPEEQSYFDSNKQWLKKNRELRKYQVQTTGQAYNSDFRIPIWVNPQYDNYNKKDSDYQQKNIQYAFKDKDNTFKQIVFNDKLRHLRRSDELDELYHKQFNSQTFSKLKNIQNYNFGYNYQIYDEQKENKLQTMQDGPIIHQFIQEIIDDLNSYRTYQISKFINYFGDKIHKKVQESQFQKQKWFTSKNTRQKLFRPPIQALGSYLSTIQSGTYIVMGQLNKKLRQIIKQNILKSQIQQQNKNQPDPNNYVKKIFELLLKPIQISFLPIFSKQQAATKCPSCLQKKIFKVDIAKSLFDLSPLMWRSLNLFLINQNKIVYSNKQVLNKDFDQVSEIIDLVVGKQNQMQKMSSYLENKKQGQNLQVKKGKEEDVFGPLIILSGAQQIDFKVYLLPQGIKQNVSVKIACKYYQEQSNQIKGISTIIQSEIQNPNSRRHLYFCKLRSLTSSTNKNKFDRYIYKQVQGQVKIGRNVQQFNFKIANYSRLLRYGIYVKYDKNAQEGKKIQIQIEDADYDMKYQYYLNWPYAQEQK